MAEMPVSKKRYGYPAKYEGLRPLDQQIAHLVSLGRSLGFAIDPEPAYAAAERASRVPCPERAEGWGAVFSPALVDSLRREREVSIELLRTLSEVDVRFEGADFLDDERFKRDPCTEKALARLSLTQPGDITVLPIQFGKRYAEVPDSEAMIHFGKDTGEFGLGLLPGASLLATHPERIGEYADLGVSLPGDWYDYGHNRSFKRLCLVKTLQKRITIMHFRKNADWMRDHGAASGFLWE